MKSPAVALWLRRAEIVLWVIGIALVGGALAVVVNSRLYQARQGRAFSDLERRAAAPTRQPDPASLPGSTPERPPAPALGADPLVLGLIEIPRVGVATVVREGDDDETLAVAVGHIPGTARPGERGNMALAGHRDSFFRALRQIELDDTILIRAAGRRDEYRVDSIAVVGPEETRVLAPTADAVLTLVTCYPFVWVGHAPNRFIVRARLSLPQREPSVEVSEKRAAHPGDGDRAGAR